MQCVQISKFWWFCTQIWRTSAGPYLSWYCRTNDNVLLSLPTSWSCHVSRSNYQPRLVTSQNCHHINQIQPLGSSKGTWNPAYKSYEKHLYLISQTSIRVYGVTVWDLHLSTDIWKVERVERLGACFVKNTYHWDDGSIPEMASLPTSLLSSTLS